MKSRWLLNVLVLPLIFLFSSCYYTAHSYNHGKLLDPGDMIFTAGVGTAKQVVDLGAIEDTVAANNDSGFVINTHPDLHSFWWRSIHLGYQLGVQEYYPFGGGIEIGIAFEFQFYKIAKKRATKMLPALDFNARLGFKDIVTKRAIYQHNLELGWTTGLWLDTGWFLGYAGGWEFKRVIPYVGIRTIYMPTNVLAVMKKTPFTHKDFWKKHDQKFNVRFAIGTSIKLAKLKMLPDFITPEITITGPNGSIHSPVSTHFHIGFRWTNGL